MIKLASYNIRKAIGTDRLRRPERILDVINEIAPDAITLQEADRRFRTRKSALCPDLIASYTDMVPVRLNLRPDSIGWHGNAILVHSSASVKSHAVIELPTLEPRGAVLADIEIRGQKLRIVGMHLDLSGFWRRKQIRAIFAAIAERPPLPTVLMGDLNEWSPHGGCFVEFAHDWHVAPTGPSFHAQRPIAKLDRIIVDRDIHIHHSGTHHSVKAKRASDHLPVWAELAF
ncbi:MAG: hypothetical protein RLZZ366_2333 [Pseudomonadota bacterium]